MAVGPGMSVLDLRTRLPAERRSITFEFRITEELTGHITVGMSDDGRPLELFIDVDKHNEMIAGLLDTVATLISVCLQLGVPLGYMVEKFSYTKFSPYGMTNHTTITHAHSVMDFVVRWMAHKFPESLDPTEKNLVLLMTGDDPVGVFASVKQACTYAKKKDIPQCRMRRAPLGGAFQELIE